MKAIIPAVLAATLCGACAGQNFQTGTGNDTELAKRHGARTVSKSLQIGFDITNTSYQTPAGSCPYYIGTQRYEQLCWPAPGGVILQPLEYPWYYDSSPQGQRTVVASWSVK